MLKFLVALLTTLVVSVTGVQVVFDNAADIAKVAEVSCPYQDDYTDFWVYGCPREPKDDIFPDKSGFWTGCGTGCSLIYHGGSLPKPTKLWVSTYMTGSPASIAMSGKSSMGEGGSGWDFGYVDSTEEVWCYEEVDLADFPGQEAAVINFTVSGAPSGGYVLIDKIVVDLGNAPISPISIDKKEDKVAEHWSYDDCHHLDHYSDFWAFGCPVEPEEEQNGVGYWSPCQERSCKIEYATSPSIIPSAVHIKGYIEGEGQIKVAAVTGSGQNISYTTIDTKSAKIGSWLDYTFDLKPYRHHKFQIVLESNGGSAMLDSLSFVFDDFLQNEPAQNELPLCIRKPQTEPPTTTTPRPTTTTPTTTTGGPTTTGTTTVVTPGPSPSPAPSPAPTATTKPTVPTVPTTTAGSVKSVPPSHFVSMFLVGLILSQY